MPATSLGFRRTLHLANLWRTDLYSMSLILMPAVQCVDLLESMPLLHNRVWSKLPRCPRFFVSPLGIRISYIEAFLFSELANCRKRDNMSSVKNTCVQCAISFFEAQVVNAQSTLQLLSNVTTRFILSNQQASPCRSYPFWNHNITRPFFRDARDPVSRSHKLLRSSLPHTTHSSRVASCPYKPAYRSVVSSLSLVNIISFIWTPGLGTRNIRLRLPNHHDIWSNYPCTHNHPHHPIFSTRLTHSMEHVFQRKELTSSVQDFVKEIKKDLHPKTKLKTEPPQGLWRKFRWRSKLVSKNDSILQ